jgi:hypothetical protein
MGAGFAVSVSVSVTVPVALLAWRAFALDAGHYEASFSVELCPVHVVHSTQYDLSFDFLQ